MARVRVVHTYPTNTDGMQNGSSVGIYTLPTSLSLAPNCTLSGNVLTKFGQNFVPKKNWSTDGFINGALLVGSSHVSVRLPALLRGELLPPCPSHGPLHGGGREVEGTPGAQEGGRQRDAGGDCEEEFSQAPDGTPGRLIPS